jgi:hypothetical protein
LIIPQAPDAASVPWRKSSYSGGGNNCVEAARVGDACAVRDSKDPEGGHLTFSTGAWRQFLAEVKRGAHDGCYPPRLR